MYEESEEEYITISKASKYTGVSKNVIYKAIRAGKLKSNNPKDSSPNEVCKKSLEKVFGKTIEENTRKTLGLVQAANFLKVSRVEFYKLIEDGILKTTGEGFYSQIKVSDLEDYLSGALSPEKENKG